MPFINYLLARTKGSVFPDQGLHAQQPLYANQLPSATAEIPWAESRLTRQMLENHTNVCSQTPAAENGARLGGTPKVRGRFQAAGYKTSNRTVLNVINRHKQAKKPKDSIMSVNERWASMISVISEVPGKSKSASSLPKRIKFNDRVTFHTNGQAFSHNSDASSASSSEELNAVNDVTEGSDVAEMAIHEIEELMTPMTAIAGMDSIDMDTDTETIDLLPRRNRHWTVSSSLLPVKSIRSRSPSPNTTTSSTIQETIHTESNYRKNMNHSVPYISLSQSKKPPFWKMILQLFKSKLI